MHRGVRAGVDWLNLNGQWCFEFDPADVGLASHWAQLGDARFSRRIMVPFPWESHLAWGTEELAGNDNWFSPEAYLDPSQATLETYRHAPRHTIGWYRRGLRVPSAWRGRRVFLNIGAVDWHCRVWVNGIEVGHSASGYVPVSFDITDALSWDGDEITIRVEDPLDHANQPIGKQVERWYERTSGIWQTVWLEPRADAHVTEVMAHPSLASSAVSFDAQVTALEPSGQLELHVQVRTGSGVAAGEGMVSVPSEGGCAQVHVALGKPQPWTPETPHLYRATITLLRDGEAIDRLNTSFGLRDIGVQALPDGGPAYICLNGKPVYLRGALDQSFHPAGVYSYPTDDALRADLLLAREAGFNFLRLHIKAEDPRLYYWADRLGMLLMVDMPNVGYDAYSEEARANWEWTTEAVIRRDFNHPSIFSWCLFNETWGLGGNDYANLPDRHAWVRECYEAAKRLDPTRLIEDNSACLYDHVATDINSWHFYINDYDAARAHVENVVANTHAGSEFNYVGGNVQGLEPLLNSEYGGISARMGDLDVSWCFLFLTNELRRHEQVCGYVYTELQDIEWEHNGVYDYDRSRKDFGYDPALLQGERFVGIDGPPALTVEPGESVRIPVFLRPSRHDWAAETVRWHARFWDALGQPRELVVDQPLAELAGDTAVIELALPDEPGLARVEVNLLDGAGRVQAMNLCFIESVSQREGANSVNGAQVISLSVGDGDLTCDGETERGEVDGDAHLLSGMGDSTVAYTFSLPEDAAERGLTQVTFIAELSSRREGAPQTGVDRWPADITVRADGVDCCSLTLADQPADATGALSHLHGFQGRYGELVSVSVPTEAVADAVSRGALTVTISSRMHGGRGGGLALYGARAGRYPCDICLVLE